MKGRRGRSRVRPCALRPRATWLQRASMQKRMAMISRSRSLGFKTPELQRAASFSHTSSTQFGSKLLTRGATVRRHALLSGATAAADHDRQTRTQIRERTEGRLQSFAAQGGCAGWLDRCDRGAAAFHGDLRFPPGRSGARALYSHFGGFVVSLLGGSRFQIGGPAGAFIVLVAACVTRNGIEGLILATMMSGLFLIAAGFLRSGSISNSSPTRSLSASRPHRCHHLLGRDPRSLRPHDTGQGARPARRQADLPHGYMGTISAQATAVAVFTIAVILLLKRFLPNWPGC